MSASALLLDRLQRHANLRWVGVGLFLASAPGVVLVVGRVVTGHAPLGYLIACLGAVGLPLGAFGTNNDTAVHAMRELDAERGLPSRFAEELADERRLRAEELAEVHASPKSAFVFPILASLAVLWLYHLAGVFG